MMMLKTAVFSLVALGSCVLAQEPANQSATMDVFRLPGDTEPLSYTLRVWPFVNPEKDSFTFEGEVVIRVLAINGTDELTLNAVDLNVMSVAVTDLDKNTELDPVGFAVVARNEQLKIQVGSPGLIADRTYDVKIKYTGNLRDDMTGFYRSSYQDPATKGTKYVTSFRYISERSIKV